MKWITKQIEHGNDEPMLFMSLKKNQNILDMYNFIWSKKKIK